jgi:glycosyltransferase involved in cell wall biosynthesis
MKLLLTADPIGGVWSYALELARGLARHDVRIELATFGAPLDREQRGELHRLDHVTLHESRFKLSWMEQPWPDVTASREWLHELAERTAPDLVHANDFGHAAAGWQVPLLLAGHCCVLSWYEAVRGTPAPPSRDRYRAEVAHALRSADLVVTPTRAMLRTLHRLYGPVPAGLVIPNGRDPQAFRKEAKLPLIFSAGRAWDAATNIAMLARIAGRLAWEVRIAGDTAPGGAEAPVPGASLLGRLGPGAIADWLAVSSIFVLPARYEPFGLAALEAGLSRCALVLGDIESLREIWADAAWFVPPGDDAALLAIVERLIRSPRLVAESAARAEQRARTFTSARMADAYAEIYASLLRARPPAQIAAGRAAARPVAAGQGP